MADTGSPFGATAVPTQYQSLILAASARWGISPALLAAQINQESGFNPTAVSSAGAQGIAQFMPGTAKAMGVNPWDPASAIDGMARYDRQNYDKFGTVEKMLAAYNGGPGVANDPSKWSRQTKDYVSKIMGKVGGALSGLVSGGGNLLNPSSDQGGLPALTKLTQTMQDPGFWRRTGVGAMGVAVALAGAYFVMEKQGFSIAKRVESVL